MGVKQIATSRFIKWLEWRGLRYVRTKVSHDIYNYPEGHKLHGTLLRAITVRAKEKEIPITHIHTNLSTLKVSKAEFEEQIKHF